jgi:hypothetical protein
LLPKNSLWQNDYSTVYEYVLFVKLSEKEVLSQPDGLRYADDGISKIQTFNPLQFRVNALNLKLPANFDLRITRGGNRYFFM